MANHLRGTVIAQLRLMLAKRKVDPRSDSELLNQFIATRDEGAFTLLVARHAGTVWDVCYEVLENVTDVEDAFQRTFLLLSQRAGLIVRQKAVSSWLIGTARRESWSLRRTLIRQRRLLEKASASARSPFVDTPPHVIQEEIAALLRAEVAALPEHLRVPLVQRYLQDKTLEEIGFLLGCTGQAVGKRLVRGETLLRKRLAIRGMSAGSAGMGALLGTASLKAEVSPRVVEKAIRAAMSAPPGSTGWLASVSAVFGRLLTSRMGLGLVVLVGLLLTGGLYGLMRSPAAAAPFLEQPQRVTLEPPPDNHRDDKPLVAEDKGNAPPHLVQDAVPLRRTMPVTGQVVDSAGKVISNARITVLATRSNQVGRRYFHDDCLAEGDSNPEGRYRLNVPTDFPNDFPELAPIKILVYTPGHGLATTRQSLLREQALQPVTLDAEKPVQGRLLDSQGRPAVGIRVAVARVGCVICQEAPNPDAIMPPHWPKPAITDAEGRYAIAGLGRKEPILLVINDDRYGLDKVVINPGQEAPGEVHLQAPRVLRGRLRGADNHTPLAGVRITAVNEKAGERFTDQTWSSRITDAEGRFRLPLESGKSYSFEFATPEGMSYLSTIQRCPETLKPDEEAEFTLIAAVRLAGRVTDPSTNKPIANVTIQYLPTRQNDPTWRPDMLSCWTCNITTDGDGRFSLAVSRAGGHLILQAQDDDYRVVAADLGMLLDGANAAKIRHAHAIVPIDAIGTGPHADMKIELQRGVSINGRVVKPDGQPLSGGYLVSRRRVWSRVEELRPVILTPDGTFTLAGCEPGRVERVLVVDSTGQWGAVADLVAPAAPAEIVTIRAERCGQALVILLDADGNPMPDRELKLMVNLPEPGALLGKPAATNRKNARIIGVLPELPKMVTDEQGQVRLPFLVPNATYRLVDKSETLMLTDPFQVAPGQKLGMKIQLRKPSE